MKTKIKRHSRSVISVVLAVCMLVSCMTVGIIATDAAGVTSGSVGDHNYNSGSYKVISSFNSWSTTTNMVDATEHSSTEHIDKAVVYMQGNSIDYNNHFRFYDSDKKTQLCPNSGSDTKLTGTGQTSKEGKDGAWYINEKDLGTSDSTWYKVTLYQRHDGTLATWYASAALSALTPSITTKKGSSATDLFVLGDTVSLSTATTNNEGTVSCSYKYKLSDAENYTNADEDSFTPAAVGVYTIQVTATDGGIVSGKNARTSRTATATKTITVIPQLTTPNISFDYDTVDDYANVTGAAHETVTLTDANYATIKAADSSFTYTLYKNGNPVTAGVNTYTDNGNGTFTIPAKAANDGSYTLKAVSSTPTTIADSLTSPAATLTVHSPMYSLVGNVDNHYMVGSTITNPDEANPKIASGTWWRTYHSEYAVSTATGTPGVYRIQFKTKTEEELKAKNHTTINIGVVSKPASGTTGTQYAFVIDNYYYNFINANKDGDYVVPEAGCLSDDFYLCGVSTNAGTTPGGSLVLKPNTTYVFQIDQTKRRDDNHPWGKLALYSNSYNVTALAKASEFDAQAGAYKSSLVDATNMHGTVSATPSRVDKNNTSLLTATPASGYTFEGWYTDNNDGTWTTLAIDEAKTYYAKFVQTTPALEAITTSVSVSGTGSISLVTGAHSGVQDVGGTYKAYVGARISVTANNNTLGYKISHWVVNGKRVEDEGYKLTNLQVTGAMTIQAVFVAATSQKITIRVNDTDYGSAVAKVGDDTVTAAAKDAIVDIVLDYDDDAMVESITATDTHGANVALVQGVGDNSNIYSFTMGYDDVTVNVNYTDYIATANWSISLS